MEGDNEKQGGNIVAFMVINHTDIHVHQIILTNYDYEREHNVGVESKSDQARFFMTP